MRIKAHAVHGMGFGSTLRLMAQPWNDWYHCNGNTYGTWVRGSELGYRERHHRKHVVGDYKHRPPVDRDERLRERSRRLMRQAPVFLTDHQARLAGTAMVRRLLQREVELLALAVNAYHFHLLGRFPDHRPRYYVGLAKQYAAYMLTRDQELKAPIWAKRCRCLPIADRKHQVNVYSYVLEHEEKGPCFLWNHRMAAP